jgi:hypothetical protein
MKSPDKQESEEGKPEEQQELPEESEDENREGGGAPPSPAVPKTSEKEADTSKAAQEKVITVLIRIVKSDKPAVQLPALRKATQPASKERK